MMFATCEACGAVRGTPCYPECPVTGSLVRRAEREAQQTERIVRGLRRAGVPGQRVEAYRPTPEGLERLLAFFRQNGHAS